MAAVEMAWPRPVISLAPARGSQPLAVLGPVVGPSLDGSSRAALAGSTHLAS